MSKLAEAVLLCVHASLGNRHGDAQLSRRFPRIVEAGAYAELYFNVLRPETTCRLCERTNLSDVEIAKILGWRWLR